MDFVLHINKIMPNFGIFVSIIFFAFYKKPQTLSQIWPGKLPIDIDRSTNFVNWRLKNFGRCRFWGFTKFFYNFLTWQKVSDNTGNWNFSYFCLLYRNNLFFIYRLDIIFNFSLYFMQEILIISSDMFLC